MQFNNRYQRYHKEKLPHIQPQESIIFITIRLDIHLNQEYFDLLIAKKAEITNSVENIHNEDERKIIFNKKLFAVQDKYFDCYQDTGNLFINSKCAKVLENELHNFNGIMYELYAFTIMPNHVHFLCRPLLNSSGEEYSLAIIMNRIKGRTARFINQEMNRSGSLWQKEYYDHYVRNEQELNNIVRYIVLNPMKAGLVDQPRLWKWTWVSEEYRNVLDEDYLKEEDAVWGAEKGNLKDTTTDW